MRGSARQIKRHGRQALVLLLDQTRVRGRRLAERLVNRRGKLHMPSKLGVTGFFAALEGRGAWHVVPCWFEERAHVEHGHDLDILAADGAAEILQKLLSASPSGQKIDCCSQSGADGTGYRPELREEVPAFPVAVDEQILASARSMPGGWQVPGPREHFPGLACHVVSLKGNASGLPPDVRTPARKGGWRECANVLTELAATVGVALKQLVTMASPDRTLRAEGWASPPDHLDALAPANRWIGDSR